MKSDFIWIGKRNVCKLFINVTVNSTVPLDGHWLKKMPLRFWYLLVTTKAIAFATVLLYGEARRFPSKYELVPILSM